MKAIRLKTEYLREPLGLGNRKPRFSWNAEGGIRQTAYRITCRDENQELWDSGKVNSGKMTQIFYEGAPLQSRMHVQWSVQLWDENDQPGEEEFSWFEIGLQEEDWKARWISGNYKPEKNRRYPADYFRKVIRMDGNVVSARLYITARGVYRISINNETPKQFILAPGSTDYRKRIQIQTLDVTSYLKEENTLEVELGDGWYRGSTAAFGVTNVYGTETSFIAQLEVRYEDGRTACFITDSSWQWSNDGPIRFNDLKDGEIYDARMHASYSGTAKEVSAPEGKLVHADNVPVVEAETFRSVLLTAADGTKVLDFGQNIAGYLEFTVQAEAGKRLRLVMGEVLDEEGHVDLSGVQETRPANGWTGMALLRKLMTTSVKGTSDPTPRQEIVLITSGNEDHYKTTFSVFGFRYAEIDSSVELNPENVTAICVRSDLEETGTFECSNADVNRLLENTRWSMKGNFLDVPTDCPTRERLGWTGDAQIFFETGAFLMDTAPFFGKWMRDMQDAQYKNGLLPAVLPYGGVEQMYKSTGSSVGWADAVYLIPYRYSKQFNDRSVLKQYWPMMKRYADYLLTKVEKDGHYEKGIHLGEWLEPEEFRDEVYGAKAKHPEECTAYLYLAMNTICEIAEEIGEDYSKYRTCAANAKNAYLKYAELDTNRQAKLVRPLALGLLDGDTKKKAQERLVQAVDNYNYCVGTGFLSTPFLLPVLTEAGAVDTAYKMLLNPEKPGWLAEVKDGATTIWENWEGNLSQNHYSPGSVCQWLFDTCAGIRVDGENHFVIAPVPGNELDFAGASWRSVYGEVKSEWKRNADGLELKITIPENCTADIYLPDGTHEVKESGTYEYARIKNNLN